MTTLKTCLLISDDPDDHFEFSEALNETSADAILLSAFNSNHVVTLLQLKRVIPDVIFLDLSMAETHHPELSALLESDESLKRTKLVLYGNDANTDKEKPASAVAALAKDFSYSELKDFVKRIVANPDT
jgi:CheY-like chemotaxis protein